MLAHFQHSFGRTASTLRGMGLIAVAVALPLSLYGQNPPLPEKYKDLVKAEAHLSVDRLPAGEKCQILVRLTVDPKWHIGANPKFKEIDVETEVKWKGKLGSKLVQVKYPAGKKYKPDGEEEQLVYYGKDGKIDIRGVLEIPADAGGSMEEMELTIDFQACDESVCLRPYVLKLAAKLPVAKPGETVKQINEKLFPPPPK